MLFVIDGTGETDDAAYRASMSGSFCRQLIKTAGARYFRGPRVDGFNTYSIAEAVLKELLAERKRFPDEDIFLAGHSRGGAGVIRVAQWLDEQPVSVPVRAMFLYDAVDRTAGSSNVQTVPKNVRNCYHARRDRKLASYYDEGMKQARQRYEACLKANGGRPGACALQEKAMHDMELEAAKMKRAMRSTTFVNRNVADGGSMDFGNCGTSGAPGCHYEEEYFLGSHGAIGGAPIRDESAPRLLIDSDRAAIASVAAWMGGHQQAEKLFAQPGRARASDADRAVSKLLGGGRTI